jgi:Endonuclease-reverse transcriptase
VYNSYKHYTYTGGFGILIGKDIPHSEIKLDSPLQAVACRISIPKPISVCSVYLCLRRVLGTATTFCLLFPNCLHVHVLLMGDFNSHSTLWVCSSTSQKGLEIENFLMQSNLCLLNNKSTTYLHLETGTSSSLDLAFCDPTLSLNYTWSVLSDLYGSDHHPTMVAKPATEAV